MRHPVPWVSIRRGWIPGAHRGIDYQWQIGNVTATRRVLAALAGTVIGVYDAKHNGPTPSENGGWGGRVRIRHNSRVQTAYSHLAKGGIRVHTGQSVAAGEHLATMGDTGDSAAGVHLHFELYIDGVRVDPAPYLSGARPLPGYPPAPPSPSKPLNPLEVSMATYVRPKGRSEIYEISQGRKYHLTPQAWKAIKAAHAQAGIPVPYAADKLTAAEIAKIPG